jgi:hypothetical protein
VVRASAETAIQKVYPEEVKSLINDKGFGELLLRVDHQQQGRQLGSIHA